MSSAVEFFKENLVKIMKDRGLSQKELASKVEIVPQALNKYLKGHRIPGLEVIDKFAQALNLSPHVLISNPKYNPQVYLSKEEVYEAFLKAHSEKNKESSLVGLTKEEQIELENISKEMGGWKDLYHMLKEELEMRENGKQKYFETKKSIFGPPDRGQDNGLADQSLRINAEVTESEA